MSKEYTPPPWFWDKDNGCIEDDSMCGIAWVQHHGNVKTVQRTGENYSHADARLIAAVPDLLAACEEADVLFAHGVGAMSYLDADKDRNIEAAKVILAQLRASIAKAKGDT